MGKDSYDQAQSFRPITLTSYLFKGLEKLVYWHIEGSTLRQTHTMRTNTPFKLATVPKVHSVGS